MDMSRSGASAPGPGQDADAQGPAGPGSADSPRLLSAARIRELADELGIRPTKQWGQNFVIDPNTIRRIVGLADLDGSEHVLEVGPGLGSLTLGLLDEAARVTAVEIDPKLAAQLPETAVQMRPEKAQNLTVICADALKITPEKLGGGSAPDVLVANLPYNVAVPVVLHLLQVLPDLAKGLVMVQEEVADRLVAAPGSKIYGVPSAKIAWDTQARKVGVVGKKVFWPEPRISSGLVRFDRGEPASLRSLSSTASADLEQVPVSARLNQASSPVSRQEVFRVIDAAFAQRRKTLRAALAALTGSGAAAEEALRTAGVDPQARGETLDVASFARIAAALR